MADYALAPPPPPSLAGGTTAQAGAGVEGYDLERLADELEGIVRGDVVGVDVDVVDVVIVEGRYLLCSRRLVEVAGVKVCVQLLYLLIQFNLRWEEEADEGRRGRDIDIRRLRFGC